MGLPIASDTLIVRDNHSAVACLDGNAVVLSLHAGSYFTFNEVGTDIWNMLARPHRVGRICHELLRRHEIDEQTLVADVLLFLEQLARNGLVQVIDNR